MTKGQVSVARSGNIYFSGRVLTERAPAIFISRFADGKYSPPEKLTGPIAEAALLVVDPWVDPDERFLLVSCPPAEGPPMLPDIGISSRLSDGTWSKPVRLTGPVNTPTFERFATLSPDGRYLFFIRAYGQQFVSDQAGFYPVVLPYSKEYMDIEPSLSSDGTKIVFVSNRPRSGQGEPEKMPDVWMAEKTAGQWGRPVRLGPPISTDDPADIEAHPTFLPDGGIYFMRQNGKTRRLFQAARRSDGFAEPVAIPLREDLLASQFSGPCFSPDGRTLLMHSRKEGGSGNWDLYVSFKDESGSWSKLKNLGPAVNTDKQESSPTFSSDGRSIFFTRDGDIYLVSATILDGLRH
jgi:hypothetical protein